MNKKLISQSLNSPSKFHLNMKKDKLEIKNSTQKFKNLSLMLIDDKNKSSKIYPH